MKCVLCDSEATTTAAHMPVCEEHHNQYREEAVKYSELHERPFYKSLLLRGLTGKIDSKTIDTLLDELKQAVEDAPIWP